MYNNHLENAGSRLFLLLQITAAHTHVQLAEERERISLLKRPFGAHDIFDLFCINGGARAIKVIRLFIA